MKTVLFNANPVNCTQPLIKQVAHLLWPTKPSTLSGKESE